MKKLLKELIEVFEADRLVLEDHFENIRCMAQEIQQSTDMDARNVADDIEDRCYKALKELDCYNDIPEVEPITTPIVEFDHEKFKARCKDMCKNFAEHASKLVIDDE